MAIRWSITDRVDGTVRTIQAPEQWVDKHGTVKAHHEQAESLVNVIKNCSKLGLHKK